MRILIYIEPFPVRQVMDHYRDYAAAFAKMLLSQSAADHLHEFDVRLYANRETLAHIQDEALAAKRYFLRPESQEQDQFRTSLTEWANKGVRTWTSLLTGQQEVTSEYQRIFEQIHQRFPFDVVITIGDNGAAKAFAQAANLDHLVLDFSLSKPSIFDAAMLDPSGTGGSAVLAHINVSTVRSMVGKEAWPAELDQSCVSEFKAADMRRQSVGPIDFTGQDRVLRRGNGRAALVCLQEFDDPLFRAHSKFSSPAQLLQTCLPELADNGIITLVRPPQGGSTGPGQAEALTEARQTLDTFSDMAVWLDHNSEQVSDIRLYTLCDLVVTANGPAGLEAALFDKQICVLGGASYKPIGAFPNLSAAVSRHYDNRTYLRNLAALRAFMLRSKLVASPEVFSFDTFAGRLSQTLVAWHENEATPKLTLADLYAHYAPETAATLKSTLDPRNRSRSEPARDHTTSEDAEPDTKAQWRKSVSSLTSRARRSLGRKILQTTSLMVPPGTGPLASSPLFAGSSEHPGSTPLPHHALSEDEEKTLIAAQRALQKRRRSRATFAVIAHCFYRDGTQRLMDRLQAVEQRFDLFASVPPFGADEIRRIIRGTFPAAKVVTLPNRGRDVWPFCLILSALSADRYTYVLKLHTPKPQFESGEIDEDLGDTWLDYCLTSLLGDPGDTSRIDEVTDPERPCSLAGPYGLLTSSKQHALNLTFDATIALDGLDQEAIPHYWTYFRGGMYWIKIDILQPLLKTFSTGECYTPGAYVTESQMTSLAPYAFALAAHQADEPILGLSDEPIAAVADPRPESHVLNDTLRAFASAGHSGYRIIKST